LALLFFSRALFTPTYMYLICQIATTSSLPEWLPI